MKEKLHVEEVSRTVPAPQPPEDDDELDDDDELQLHDDDHVSYYSMRSAAQAIEFLHRRKVGRERLLCQQPTTRAAVYYHQALAHNTIHGWCPRSPKSPSGSGDKSPLPQKIKLINKEAPYIHPRLQATRIPYTRCHPAAETVYTLHPM